MNSLSILMIFFTSYTVSIIFLIFKCDNSLFWIVLNWNNIMPDKRKKPVKINKWTIFNKTYTLVTTFGMIQKNHHYISLNLILEEGHNLLTGHWSHNCFFAWHKIWPKPTIAMFMSFQYFLANSYWSLSSVSFGVFVFTHPSLLLILWTWVSTPIPSILFSATLR